MPTAAVDNVAAEQCMRPGEEHVVLALTVEAALSNFDLWGFIMFPLQQTAYKCIPTIVSSQTKAAEGHVRCTPDMLKASCRQAELACAPGKQGEAAHRCQISAGHLDTQHTCIDGGQNVA